MPRKLSEEEIQQEIDVIQDGRIKIIGEYKNNVTPVMVRCANCGLEWMSTPKLLRMRPVGVGCHHHIKLTEKHVRQRIYYATNNTITMLGKYVGSRTKTKMHCNKCNYEWLTQPYLVYKGHGCPDCAGKRQKTTKEVGTLIKKATNGEYELVGEYLGTHRKMTILHKSKKCGRTFDMSFHAFCLNGQRCPFERRERFANTVKKSQNDFLNDLKRNRQDEYILIGEYKNASTLTLFEHKTCGTKFYALPTQVSHFATGCPRCNESKGESAVRSYLKHHGFQFKSQYRIKECKLKRPLPFDFALFDHNHLSCLIEYQGVQHYQPKFGKKNFEDGIVRDHIKRNYCNQHGIKLICIPYKRWTTYSQLQKQVYSYLDNNLTC